MEEKKIQQGITAITYVGRNKIIPYSQLKRNNNNKERRLPVQKYVIRQNDE